MDRKLRLGAGIVIAIVALATFGAAAAFGGLDGATATAGITDDGPRNDEGDLIVPCSESEGADEAAEDESEAAGVDDDNIEEQCGDQNEDDDEDEGQGEDHYDLDDANDICEHDLVVVQGVAEDEAEATCEAQFPDLADDEEGEDPD
ncbi:MAG: hypothetical protein WEB00_03660 [Dehalococcoidia bacterium]